MEDELNKAIQLRKNGNHEKSNQLLLELVSEYPEEASINYQCAWSFDLLGKESEAIFYYEKAITLGLPSHELEGALLGLGSTYRTLGRYEESKQTFERGLQLFPNNQVLKVFYSMTLYNLREQNKAMELLLTCLIETTADEKILAYKRAIEFYSDKLDQTWK